MEIQRTITDLPLEVLDLIFKNLSYLKTKVSLAQACEKLGKAFAFHCRNEFRKLAPSTKLTPELWVFVIQECGSEVEELFYNGLSAGLYWNDLIAQAVVKHCPNLKSLSTCVYRSHVKSVQSFIMKMKSSLVSVTLDQRESFPQDILKTVSEITQLKKLSFKGNVDENVYHIQNLVALEKLAIENQYYLTKTSVNLLRVCAPLRKLRDLTAFNIKIVSSEEPYSEMWVALKSLSLIRCELSNELPDCPELTYLDIESLNCRTEGYILGFILKNGENLTRLYESCYPQINADGFLQLLRGCPKLRYFYTPMDYIKLYSTYVSAIVEILEANGVTREDPLELVISRRIKWKWFRRLLLRTPNSELIELYEGGN